MREYWATYSVKDHLEKRAFVADIMLYDRIVVPHPPDDKERALWADNGWDPDMLDQLLEIIGPDRSRKIPWDEYRKQEWQNRMAAADNLNQYAFQATRDVLTADLPPFVTGVQADLACSDPQNLKSVTGFRPRTEENVAGTALIATVLGKRFLVPAAESYPDDIGALHSALALSADNEFKKKRRAYFRWQREFLEECSQFDRVWEQGDREQIVAKAIEEMQDLIADEERALRIQRIKLGTLFTFTVTGSSLALIGSGPINPIGLAGAFVSVGAFVVDQLLEPAPANPPPAAFFTSVNQHFGWTEQ